MTRFALTTVAGDTARFVDPRIGLSMLVPGRPHLLDPAPGAGVTEPAYEVALALADAPITIRYRVDDRPTAAPVDVLPLAEAYAANRCHRAELRRAQPATPEQRLAWGVTAAASTLYPLRDPGGDGDDTEEVLLLARDAQIVVITKRFARARLSWVTWALCSSALAAGLRWDPSARGAPATLWPPSSFLRPGVQGRLSAARRPAAEQLAACGEQGERAAEALVALVQGHEPPAQPVGRDDVAAYQAFVADAFDDNRFARILAGLLAEARTAHDVRGIALLGLHALGKVDATFDADDADDAAHPLAYLAE